MILVKSRAYDKHGRKCAELRTVRDGDHFVTTVVLTGFFPDGPDVVAFRSWTASSAREFHLGGARAIAGRDGRVEIEVPGLMDRTPHPSPEKT